MSDLSLVIPQFAGKAIYRLNGRVRALPFSLVTLREAIAAQTTASAAAGAAIATATAASDAGASTASATWVTLADDGAISVRARYENLSATVAQNPADSRGETPNATTAIATTAATLADDAGRLDLSITPSQASAERGIELLDVLMSASLLDSIDDRVYHSGYQSWTDSKEFTRNDRMIDPSRVLAPVLKKYRVTRYADYEFEPYSRRKGISHGASYGWIRPAADREGAGPVLFYGSLDERTGFTFFRSHFRKRRLTVRKDCEGLAFRDEYRAFRLFFCRDAVDRATSRYLAAMGCVRRPASPATGWTSWYNYYQNISEKVILENLEAFVERRVSADIFQIDDGYQTAVGDWLSITDRFPNGMKAIADRIRSAGYKPGLWLAPFAGELKSELFTDHRDWFVAGSDGQPYHAGSNWSGFFALDIYNEDVRAYLRHVFDVVLNDWGFELVKLDFLYAACIIPRHGKTRGQIMCEAMDFLRECVGERQILGCGIPLWMAFGTVEYCRVGTDIDLIWHNELYGALLHREIPSTKLALQNAIWRQHLDGKAFVNDPDVFLLRDTNLSLTAEQKKTILAVNRTFGNLLFTSDNIAKYTPEQEALFRTVFPPKRRVFRSLACDDGLYTARYVEEGRNFTFLSNQCHRARRVRGLTLAKANPASIEEGLELQPFETRIVED